MRASRLTGLARWYIDKEEHLYLVQRDRKRHDFTLTGPSVAREGDVALKVFDNTLLPMMGLSMFAVMTLKKAVC